MNLVFATVISIISSLFLSTPNSAIQNNAASAYLASGGGINVYNSEDKDVPLVTTRILTDTDLKNKKPLDSKQIFDLTNKERVAKNLKPLVWNDKLAKIAEFKSKDMIAKQYFAHKSPDGLSVNNLADKFNYSYSLIGENLAMGDFINSVDVVNGWMNSPGHRANILKPTYTELGVYSIYGADGNHNVWFAVQEFGRPSPNCIKPDTNIEALIISSSSKIKIINSALESLRKNIESSINGTSGFKGIVDSYNNLINLSNILYKKSASVVSEYNKTVKNYNDCIMAENKIINGTI